MIFCDKLGTELNIGDAVVFISPEYKELRIGKIVRFANKTVIVQYVLGNLEGRKFEVPRSSKQIIKVRW